MQKKIKKLNTKILKSLKAIISNEKDIRKDLKKLIKGKKEIQKEVFLVKFQNISRYKNLTIVNNFFRSIFIYKHPVSSHQIKYDKNETDGFHKFSFDFLSNMNSKEKLLFHKFVPDCELPYVINYLNKLQNNL